MASRAGVPPSVAPGPQTLPSTAANPREKNTARPDPKANLNTPRVKEPPAMPSREESPKF